MLAVILACSSSLQRRMDVQHSVSHSGSVQVVNPRPRPVAVASTELIHSASGASLVHPNYNSITSVTPDRPQQSTSRCRCSRCHVQKGSLRQHAIYFFALSLASYAGVVARIYLTKLKQWNGLPLFGAFYAEVVGTAIIGFIASHKRLLRYHQALYQGIATGLCGSITTFSSWNSEAAAILLQPPDNATRFIAWITVLLLGLGMPIAALAFGRHVAHLSPWSDAKQGEEEEGEEHRPSSRWAVLEDSLIVAAWVGGSGLAVVLPLHFHDYQLLFSIAFATPGTYLRWHLAPLNDALPGFKLGTFIVNVLGSWILGALLVVSENYADALGLLGTAALVGLVNGLCGCLTTVSTFAMELTSLPLRSGYFYGFLSLLLAQVGLVVIRGPYLWTR